MGCGHDTPSFGTKKAAERHGYITYGKSKSGRRKFKVYKTKAGWNVVKYVRKK